MKVMCFRLANGMDVVARVVEEKGGDLFIVEQPMQIMTQPIAKDPSQLQLVLTPFLPFIAKTEKIEIYPEYFGEPIIDIQTLYMRVTSSLHLPVQSDINGGDQKLLIG